MRRRALTGYVGLSAAWSGSLVRSSGARRAELNSSPILLMEGRCLKGSQPGG